MTANYVSHVNGPITPDFGRGPNSTKQLVTMYRSAFPDAQITIEDIFAKGDKVMVRWTGRATDIGRLLDIDPTNKQGMVTGIDVYRISNGKIQETSINWDVLGFLQQLA